MWRQIQFATAVAIATGMPSVVLAQSNSSAQETDDAFDGPTDVSTQLSSIGNRNKSRGSLLPSPLQPLRDNVTAWKKSLYDQTRLRLGVSFHTVYQYADDVQPGFDHDGIATDFDFVGAWDLVNVGTPTSGGLYFGIEGRWDYGTTGPQTLGLANIGSAGGTANSFGAYEDPQFILRNLYWKQGSPEAGWIYRIGKITIDAMLGTNRHINPNATFLSNAGTGLFVNAYADSGLGAAGALYFNDAKGYVGATISDANGVRSDFGDIGAGDFYKALEFGYKIMPKTEKAGYSKLTIWHTDGTSDGSVANGNTGANGWGWSVVHEQELSADGKIVAVGRYGNSEDKAAVYDAQGALAVLFYEPFDWFENDVIGFQYNYIDPVGADSRKENSFEAFYRFPLLSGLDATLAYQYIDDPGNTRLVDSANVFSIRLVTSF